MSLCRFARRGNKTMCFIGEIKVARISQSRKCRKILRLRSLNRRQKWESQGEVDRRVKRTLRRMGCREQLKRIYG